LKDFLGVLGVLAAKKRIEVLLTGGQRKKENS